ncbi:MAG: type I-E CRISPR-associated endoribonuclease Cas2e [Candidatus Ancillula sp.]|jgi:CRISPR-associated protein Cas2|nr:type I-E CRISPR-associated endoribonuclease Cas2e [Candidatus Ancillula sp.]
MIVVTLTNVPNRLRGDLTKWLLEIDTGVFVGKVNARVREKLWERILTLVQFGKATMTYSANNEQGLKFKTHNAMRIPVDFDGIKLIMIPKTEHKMQKSNLKLGFSNASRQRAARKRKALQKR